MRTERLGSYVSVVVLMAVIYASFSLASGQVSPDTPPITPTNAAVNRTVQGVNKDGIPLTTVSDLSGSTSVEAVLLPYRVAKRSFGKEVAERYAVISLIVSNRDQKQGMILHSVFLDYSHWLFSGIFSAMNNSGKIPTELWQQQNKPTQVASAEVRTVRTDFQDAQLWSSRNWVIHIATAVGTTAASLAFSTGSDLYAPSVAAFNGAVVPAISLIWPENSQAQLNLLNDIGFRTNRVIPAKSSDVVIAFFPLERFLTPTLRDIYKSAPAAFFNPSELIFDKPGRSGTGKLLREIEGTGVIPKSSCPGSSTVQSVKCTLVTSLSRYEQAYEMAKSMAADKAVNPCATPSSNPSDKPSANSSDKPSDSSDIPNQFGVSRNDCMYVDLLNRISLNTIRVVVGGIMTVDVSSVPATISSVKIANETQPGTWKSGQKLTGVLAGSFLSGGTISITATDPNGKALDSTVLAAVQVDQTTGSDTSLPFSVTIGGTDIAQGSKLAFTVTKTAQDKSTTVSSPFVYTVSSDPTVSATSTWAAGDKITGSITGTGLTGVSILSVAGKDPDVLPPSNFTPSSTPGNDTTFKFSVVIGSTAVPAGSTLIFNLSTKHPDGSSVTIPFTVPAH